MSDGSGFRDSASEDPHGTRAALLGLATVARDQLERRAPSTLAVGSWILAFVAAVLGVGAVLDGGRLATGALAALAAAASIATATRARSAVCLRPAERGLEIIDARGRAQLHPWSEVVAVRVGERAVVVETRVGARSRRVRAPFVVRPGEPTPWGIDVRSGMQGFVFGMACGAAVFAGWMASVVWHAPAASVLGASALAALVVATPILCLRSQRLVARHDGLVNGTRLIPWDRVIGAQPRLARGPTWARRRGPERVRVYVEGEADLEVVVDDAEQAVATITRAKADALQRDRAAGR